MNQNQNLVKVEDGKVVADSRTIAELFEKQHKDVLKAIRNLNCSNDFKGRNFAPNKNKDLTGEYTESVDMTRDGFTFLVMGFTGEKAAQWKEAYINAFNDMEAKLRGKAINVRDPGQLSAIAIQLIEVNQELEAKIAEAQPKVEAFDRIADSDGSFCVTDAAKALQMRPKDLFSYLSQHGWTYKRAGASHWLGYQAKVTQGLLQHKVTTVLRPDGSEKITEQVRITAKGLEKLALLIPPSAQAA